MSRVQRRSSASRPDGRRRDAHRASLNAAAKRARDMPACAASASSDHAVCGASCMAVMAREFPGRPGPPAVRVAPSRHPSDNAATGSVAARKRSMAACRPHWSRSASANSSSSVGPRPGSPPTGIQQHRQQGHGQRIAVEAPRSTSATAQRHRRGGDKTMRRHARIKQQARLGNQQIFMHGRTRRNQTRAAPDGYSHAAPRNDAAHRRRRCEKRAPKAVVPEQAGQSIHLSIWTMGYVFDTLRAHIVPNKGRSCLACSCTSPTTEIDMTQIAP